MLRRPLEDISLEEVQSFCTNDFAAEGRFFEYKRDIPGSLAKVIASFANTFGGLLILGLDTDKKNKPIWPPVGIEFDRGIEERITGICLRSIEPPVIPDIRVFILPTDASRCLILVRVYESSLTPHAIDNNSRVYVRANSMSEPIQAGLDAVKWLAEKRGSAINLRESMKQGVVERFKKEYKDPTNLTTSIIQFHLCPRYPHDPLIARSQLNEAIMKLAHWDWVTTVWNNSPPVLTAVRAGIGIWPTGRGNSGNRDLPYHWEVNQFGGIHAVISWPVEKLNAADGGIISCFDIAHLSWRGMAFFKLAYRWLNALNFRGSLDFSVRIDGAWNFPLYYIMRGGPNSEEVLKATAMGHCKEPQSIVSSTSTLLSGDIEDFRKPIVDALQALLWDIGCATKTKADSDNLREICEDTVSTFSNG